MVPSRPGCRSTQRQNPFPARKNDVCGKRSRCGPNRNRRSDQAQARPTRVHRVEARDRRKFSVTRADFLKRAEWTVAILLSLTVLFLLAVRVTHAGALWRDECAVVNLARMPSVTDIAS